MSPISTSPAISGLPLAPSGATAALAVSDALPNLFSLALGGTAAGEAGAESLTGTTGEGNEPPPGGKLLPVTSGNGLPPMSAGPIAPNNAKASAPVDAGTIDRHGAGDSTGDASAGSVSADAAVDQGSPPPEPPATTAPVSVLPVLLADLAGASLPAGQTPADPAAAIVPGTMASGDPGQSPTDEASSVAVSAASLPKAVPAAVAPSSPEPEATDDATVQPKDPRQAPTLPAAASAGTTAVSIQPIASTPPPGPAAPQAGPVPGDPPAVPRHEFAQLVEKLAEAREWARPGRAEMQLAHREFGPVSMQFEINGQALKVALSSPHSGFVAAAQAAMADGPRSDSGGPRQDSAAPFHHPGSGQSPTTDAQTQRQQGQAPYRRERPEGEPLSRHDNQESAPRRTDAGGLFA
ncbi:hypothetical protein [Parerythrobacter lacustris]|uniref:Flagellar hook-length control protein FliK n=1 Tax=Parerythrobacter lacustris TaxID=2969984 RepID=A0ABT1XM79_9SPHN|nr:hypothetical protein [Parerythrobacter lacustris]MCR2832783.1 hypothetical protein [Parerythrobacter lacustris]